MNIHCARLGVATAALCLAAGLAGCGDDAQDQPAGAAPTSSTASTTSGSDDEEVTAPLRGPTGTDHGSVTIDFGDDGETQIKVKAKALPPGLHGFHVHKTGLCEPDSEDPAAPGTKGAFLSAGGHLAQPGQTHGSHDGDAPSLLVQGDGTAGLELTTDTLTRDAVLDADGSSVMVHETRDNFGNVPERYAPGGADEMTQRTGDSGTRIACAVLTAT